MGKKSIKTTKKPKPPNKSTQATSTSRKSKISRKEFVSLIVLFIPVVLTIATVDLLKEIFLAEEDWKWVFIFLVITWSGAIFLITKLGSMVDKFMKS